MASATLADLSTRLLHRISGSANDLGLSSTQLAEWINAALKHIQMADDWPWQIGLQTFNTVPNQTVYPVPYNWLRTHTITMMDVGDPLHQRTIGELDEVIFQGRPRIYAIDQEQIYVSPIPDGIYPVQHRYYSVEQILVNPTDAPMIPVQFDEGVIEWAAMIGLRYLRQEDRAKMAEQAYDQWFKITQDNARRTRETIRVRVRPGSMV